MTGLQRAQDADIQWLERMTVSGVGANSRIRPRADVRVRRRAPLRGAVRLVQAALKSLAIAAIGGSALRQTREFPALVLRSQSVRPPIARGSALAQARTASRSEVRLAVGRTNRTVHDRFR